MKINKLVYSALLSIVFLQGYSQKSQIEAANKKYNSYAYADAIEAYETIAAKGYKDEQMLQNLGNAYYFNADLPKAGKWYGELFAMKKEQQPEYYFRYAQCLKSVGKYDKANEMLEEFSKKAPNDKRAKLYAENKNYLKEIQSNSGGFNIGDAGINTESSDYGSTFLGNQLVFASARTGSSNKVFVQTNESFLDLYSSEILPNGKMDAPKQFGGKEINSKFHESTPVFTNDGKTVYFSRNNFLDGKKGKDAGSKTMLLKLYKATLEGDSWGDVKEVSFNSNNYSVSHPALSPDNKTLYFASDMPGTFGQSDLFKVAIKADGSFGTPVNLGDKINTEGRESFPFVSEDNKLYFASDGRPGLGGYDIFVAKMAQDGSFTEIKNIGAPINGSQDDFAYVVDKKNNGFFTSNRTGGKGNDDIYKFTEIVCKQQLEGLITDSKSGEILPNVKVSLLNDKFELQKEGMSDEKGHYSFDVACRKNYNVRAELADYETKESNISIGAVDGTTSLPIALDKIGCKVVVGEDLGKCFGIKVIYFDLNKAIITPEATSELAKILDVLKQNPKMKIDIRSFTDSRQTAKYNQALSQKRAKSTIDWLVKNGVDATRLSGKGYGESQLVNKCSDDVQCTEEEHKANRRSEFIVVAIE